LGMLPPFHDLPRKGAMPNAFRTRKKTACGGKGRSAGWAGEGAAKRGARVVSARGGRRGGGWRGGGGHWGADRGQGTEEREKCCLLVLVMGSPYQ